MADPRHAAGRFRFIQAARTRHVFGHQFPDVGAGATRPHERDGLRLGVDGWNGHRNLADGPIVPDGSAISAAAGCGSRVLEFGRAAGRGWNPPR